MNIQTIFLICLLMLSVGTSIYYNFPKEDSFKEGVVYQGPVPLDCDEDYFKQTGITKCLKNEK